MTEQEILIRIPKVFDSYVFALMGIIFQIFGAIFLSFKSLGKEWLSKRFSSLAKFSKWFKKSFSRMSIIFVLIFAILFLGLIFNLRIIVGLFVPILMMTGFFSFLIDHPEYYEKWILRKASEGKIGPIGFVIVAFGGLLQIISLLIHISTS